jgi:hypothetical protein
MSGAPNNLYAPIGLANNCIKKNKPRSLAVSAQTNFFALAQWSNFVYGQCQAAGVSVQGTLLMPHYLYSHIYAAGLVNHQKGFDYLHQHIHYNTSASLADTYLLLGWNALHQQTINFSIYTFGIIPAPKYTFGLDNHFAYGVGADVSARLYKSHYQRLDWLTDTDITFLTHRKGLAWIKNNGIYEPCVVTICAHQLLRMRSALAYHYQHFITDIGLHCFYTTDARYKTLVNVQTFEPSQCLIAFFCNAGARVKLGNNPSYFSLGAQITECHHHLDSGNVIFKCGIEF